jgi:alkylhydroperoxidase/carboxymuconolactone decarboxylase family protein YurZ
MSDFDAEIRDAHIRVTGGSVVILGDCFNDTKGRYADAQIIQTTGVVDFDPETSIFQTRNSRYKVTFQSALTESAPVYIAEFLQRKKEEAAALETTRIEEILEIAKSLSSEGQAMLAWKAMDIAGVGVLVALDAVEELQTRKERELPEITREEMLEAMLAVSEMDWSPEAEAARNCLDEEIEKIIAARKIEIAA